MLKITALTNAEYLISSVALGIEEYYTGSGEAPGTWAGTWSGHLGLSGEVDATELRSLIEGHDPATGTNLLAKQRPRTTRAFDLTISAPKSVSLLWAFGSPHAAKATMASHHEAVDAALEFLEQRAAVTRKQVGKVRRRVPTEGLVIARFVHRTSREGDPQLHTHCLVPNVVRRTEDGKHVALDAAPLHEWARAAGSVYQNELQRLLTERLGVEWGADRNNTRDLLGISPVQLRAFSKRSAQIEAELEAAGATYDAGAIRAASADTASLATRRAKVRSLTPAHLATQWEQEAAACGLPTGSELDLTLRHPTQPSELGWDQLVAALTDAEAGMCSRSARFDHPDVVEKICAISGGRLTTAEVIAAADRFLASRHVVRLTPDAGVEGSTRRLAAQWSTTAHRRLEDATLDLADRLTSRPALPAGEESAAAALGDGALGADQAAAVRMASGPGASLRLLTSPAGFGKTTTARAIAAAYALDGRRVLGIATTAKAVAELDAAGVPAMTIARLRIDLRSEPLVPGTVLLWDEVSQTATRDAHAVLDAVSRTEGGLVCAIGDHLQTQPVGPGGVAHHLAALARAGRIPHAELTVNRRQLDPADIEALTKLRAGDATASQAIRTANGWEHERATPTELRNALAAAAAGDIESIGTRSVAVLAVSHTDAEDLADRIRLTLSATGRISGPHLEGPGWTTMRSYQAGDRVLLHCRFERDPLLINGTTATVTEVDDASLTVSVDGDDEVRMLPAAWIAGAKPDGTPRISHAWARTVDGAQGGTWDQCHLLGTPALDAYRGYTGQSRSRLPTHTWNTTPLPDLDHGGRLVPRPEVDEQVAAALARRPDGRLAAASDPHVLDRQLRARIDEHLAVLKNEPLDRTAAVADAQRRLADAEVRASQARRTAERLGESLDELPMSHRLTRTGRSEQRALTNALADARAANLVADAAAATASQRLEHVTAQQHAHLSFRTEHAWQRREVARLQDQLADHWTATVVACIRNDEPLAYGTERLRSARARTIEAHEAIERRIPIDRHFPLVGAKREFDQRHLDREHAEHAHKRAAEEEAAAIGRLPTRKARRERDAAGSSVRMAAKQLQHATAAEEAAAGRLQDERDHQANRRAALEAVGPQLTELREQKDLIDQALDQTRAERVAALALAPDDTLVSIIGPAPTVPGAMDRWVRCAHNIERGRDHGADTGPGSGLAWRHRRSRQEIETGQLPDAAIDLTFTGAPTHRRSRGRDHGPDIGMSL